ncbi:hypothetical protein BJ322DRAFT_1080000 [Thelephora terrestris]|uniref:F-box domain-containing protein n=1 Tax=Thelephora terrestris TaxID=56493 RepID=A0A9P6H7Q4_9AGAM|nr:hypothetical protein BJ322DRAFT_1080000 [Thelephora terrestris]
MATVTTLPLEVLLLIFRQLDTIDVVCLGMTCRDLHEYTQTHPVWLDQTQNHRRRKMALKRSISSPTTLTTEALKRFATLQEKLRIRWTRQPIPDNRRKMQFAARGTILLPGRLDLTFLPGGELVISIDESDGSILLHRIVLSGGHLSLVRLADLSRGQYHDGEDTRKKMLSTMTPHPVFCYARENSVYFFGITPEGGVNLETEFVVPDQSKLLWFSGQGRIAGIVFQTPGPESLVVIVSHLDYPGVTLEVQLPPDYRNSSGELPPFIIGPPEVVVGSWKVCFPTPHLAVIYCKECILGYTIPSFSSLPHGKQRLDGAPTWRLSGIMEEESEVFRDERFVEVLYDPSPPDPRFNIHLLHHLYDSNAQAHVGLITLNIDPSDPPSASGAPTYQRIVSRFPIEGLIATGSLHPEIYHSRTRLHSEGLSVWVSSLEDISFAQANREEEGRGSLYMFVSNHELEPDLEWEGVDLDEASGRVFIWGPAFRWMIPYETRIFVGELVS